MNQKSFMQDALTKDIKEVKTINIDSKGKMMHSPSQDQMRLS